ncbi:hypothetical protein DUI87_08169 [Hirundo rustica rustica]|uniref:Uncharacterized protein n=1 Tax=Hirundo rustica rustica TaxID=333673 RepID=A0A3M0KRP0_HIRRU|nr:hypothetical protein DUI87_08169 [Hirundo rustica rustica]
MAGYGGLSRQAGGVLAGKVSSAEEATMAGPGLTQLQMGRQGALNSWALQQMIEFPGPDPPLTVDSSRSQQSPDHPLRNQEQKKPPSSPGAPEPFPLP